jgi:hypothetical protein
MKRLAIALTALLSGCIFLTPPTGLRVGDHSQEFANLVQQQAPLDASKVEFTAYEAPDFTASYPKDWGEGKKSDDMTGASTTRLAAGVRTTTGESEGLVVTTINQVQNADDPKGNDALEVLVKGLLAQGTKSFTPISEKGDATLGGEKANRLEAKATDQNGLENHMVAYSLLHQGRAWVVVLSTVEGRYASLEPVFTKMIADFKFKAATSPAPSASPSGSPTTSASPNPAASAAPSASPSQKQ